MSGSFALTPRRLARPSSLAGPRQTRARRIDIYGIGASGFVCQDLHQKLHRIGLFASAWPDPHAALTSAALLTDEDVAVAISHTGTTVDTVEPLRVAAGRGAYPRGSARGQQVHVPVRVRFAHAHFASLERDGDAPQDLLPPLSGRVLTRSVHLQKNVCEWNGENKLLVIASPLRDCYDRNRLRAHLIDAAIGIARSQ